MLCLNLEVQQLLPYSGRNRHFVIYECLYALFYGIITAL
nr:MAG TPA: hypothetical protein [Caudoviricetes sp.]